MNAQPLRPAALLGDRYRLGQLIGRGGMAEVYRATDERLGREVAIKLFRPGMAGVEDLRRVRSEIRTLAALAHPGLVTLHDAADGDDGSPAYLVLELVRGSDLGALIRTGALSSTESVELVREVAQTLAYIHARGIVHRDIKPENILVARGEDGELHAKLADLGIARILGDSRLTEAGAVIGTAAYLSPEQVMGEEVGTEADVYALGLVLLEALTGQPAYEGGKLEQALARVNRPPVIPDWLQDADAVLIEDMTARDPGDRPTARETVVELAAWSSPDLPWDDQESDSSDLGRRAGVVAGGAAAGTAVWRDDDAGWDDEDGPALATDSDPATEVLSRDDERTSVLGAAGAGAATADDRTEVLGRPREDARTSVLPAAGAGAGTGTSAIGTGEDARTRVLTPSSDAARTELLGAARPDSGGAFGPPAPPEDWARPAPAPLSEKQIRRAEARRTAWRRVTVAVIVLAVLAAAATAAFPALRSLAPTAVIDAPAYPAVEGVLGERLIALEDAAVGAGFAPDAQQRLQADVLTAATAASYGDFDASSAALDAAEVSLAFAALEDHVTGDRYDAVKAAVVAAGAEIGPARDAAAAAAAEAERQRAAAEEAERQRLEEIARQAEAERQAQLEREAAEQQDGFGQTLDDLGQSIRDQFDQWFSGN